MKILISRLTDGTFGGAELSAIDHAWAYNKLGHDVLFITNIPRDKTEGLNVVWVPWPHKFSGVIKLIAFPLAMLYQVVITLFARYTFKPDIMNPHSRDDQVLQTLLKPLHRVPTVWKDPADLRHFLERDVDSFFWKINNSLLHKAVVKTDCIYTLNPSERKLILDALKSKKLNPPPIEIIPSSILYDNYDLSAKSIKPNHKLVISTIIRLDVHKGIQYLIDAYMKIPKENTELWIVGDGPYRKELEDMASERDDIIFYGFQTDVSKYYAATDIFIQPAEFEGWGRNVKEAMYFGLPVIGSNVGGIAKQITDRENGLLFEPKNVKELADRLTKLLDDKNLREKLGKAAKKKALADGDYTDLIRDKVIPLFKEYAKS